MKRIIIGLSVLISIQAQAQFATIDSLRKFNNKYIRNSAIDAFTNLRLNTVNNGIINFLDSAYRASPASKLDSIKVINDSVIVSYKNGAVSKRDTIRVIAGSNTGSTNANVGSGYRLAIPGTNNIKTIGVIPGLYLAIDSSTTNIINLVFDTSGFATYVRSTIPAVAFDTTNTKFLAYLANHPFKLNVDTSTGLNVRGLDTLVLNSHDSIGGGYLYAVINNVAHAIGAIGGSGGGGGTQEFPNVTTMVANRPSGDSVAQVLGFVAAGDAGDGWWMYVAASTATANGMTVIAPTTGSGAGRWIQIARDGKLTLKQLGVFPSSDNTTALNAAFALAAANFELIIPRLSTYISDPNVSGVQVPSNIVLTGQEAKTSVIKAKAYTSNFNSILYADTLKNATLRNFTLDGNQKYSGGAIAGGSPVTDTAGYLFRTYRMVNNTLDGLYLKNGGSQAAIFVYEGSGNHFNNMHADSIGNIVLSTFYGHDLVDNEAVGNTFTNFGMRKDWSTNSGRRTNGNDAFELGGKGWHLINNDITPIGSWFWAELRLHGTGTIIIGNRIHMGGKSRGGITISGDLNTNEYLVNAEYANNRYDSGAYTALTAVDSTAGQVNESYGNLQEINLLQGMNAHDNYYEAAHWTINSSKDNVWKNEIINNKGSDGTKRSGMAVLLNMGTAGGSDSTLRNSFINPTIIMDDGEIVRQAYLGQPTYNLTVSGAKVTSGTGQLALGIMYPDGGTHNPVGFGMPNLNLTGNISKGFKTFLHTAMPIDFRNTSGINNLDTATLSDYSQDVTFSPDPLNKPALINFDGSYVNGITYSNDIQGVRISSGNLIVTKNQADVSTALPAGASADLTGGSANATSITVKDNASNTTKTYPAATTSVAGPMSAADKIKVDTFAVGSSKSAQITAYDSVRNKYVPVNNIFTDSRASLVPNDGTTDAAPAINKMVAAAKDGDVLSFGPGHYLINSKIVITKNIKLYGMNPTTASVFVRGSSLDTMFVFIGGGQAENIYMYDPTLDNTATAPTSGIAMYVTTAHESKFINCQFHGFYDGLILNEWIYGAVHSCLFKEYKHRGLTIRNPILPDAGDCIVDGGCQFISGQSSSTGIYQESGGGLKVIGNKFNNNGGYGQPLPASGIVLHITQSTSDLIVSNNSLENFSAYGIKIDTASGISFLNAQINGNQFAPYSNITGNNIRIDGITLGTVNSNIFLGLPGSTTNSAIYFGYSRHFKVIGNKFLNFESTDTVYIGTGAYDIDLGGSSGGVGTSGINNSTSLQSSANFNIDGIGGVGGGIQFNVTSQRSSMLKPMSVVDGLAMLDFKPVVGAADAVSVFRILPKGAGGGVKSQLTIGETDISADDVNYAALVANSTGSTGFNIGSVYGSTGSVPLRPLNIQMNGVSRMTVTPNGDIKWNGITSYAGSYKYLVMGDDSLMHQVSGGIGSFINNSTSTQSSSNFAIDGVGKMPTAVIVAPATFANNNIAVTAGSAATDLGTFQVQTETGTNTGTVFNVYPRGTGYSSGVLQTQLGLFGTNYLSDPTNFSAGVLRKTSTAFGINSINGGTGTLVPIDLQINGTPAFRIGVDGKMYALNQDSSGTNIGGYFRRDANTGQMVVGPAPGGGTDTADIAGTGVTITRGAGTRTFSAAVAPFSYYNGNSEDGHSSSGSGGVGFTFPTPSDAVNHSYQLIAGMNITAISAGSLTVTVSYTDIHSTVQTMTFYPQGATSSGIITTGAVNYPSVGMIKAAPNTNISFNWTLTGTSATFDRMCAVLIR